MYPVPQPHRTAPQYGLVGGGGPGGAIGGGIAAAAVPGGGGVGGAAAKPQPAAIPIPSTFPQLQEISPGQLAELANDDDGKVIEKFMLDRVDGVQQFGAKVKEAEAIVQKAQAEAKALEDEHVLLAAKVSELESRVADAERRTAEKEVLVAQRSKKYDVKNLSSQLRLEMNEVDKRSDEVVQCVMEPEYGQEMDVNKAVNQYKELRKTFHLHEALAARLLQMPPRV